MSHDRVVTLKSSYSARAFALAPDEQVQGTFGDFRREGRAPGLVPLRVGDRLEALTTASSAGMLYARAEKDGTPFAVLLLPDSYE